MRPCPGRPRRPAGLHPGTARPAWTGSAAGGCRPGGCRGRSPAPATGYRHVTPAPAAAACPGTMPVPPGGRASSITPGSCCRTDLTAVPAQRRAASACPREVENADQTGGFIDREYDEPEIANVGDPPSRRSGLRAEHRVVRVVADPGQQRHEHVERLLRKAAHLPERAGLQVRPAAHAWVRRSRM